MEVSTADARTWISVVLLVFTVAVLASFLPALRAARLEPMQVLRDE
jgi:ABC-type lipoprotein release transport system permease subunit